MTPEEALAHAKERAGDGNWHGQDLACDCEAQHFWPDDEEALKALADEVRRLRAENLLLAMANADREEMKAELDWFRRREQLLQRCMNEALVQWENENPKPGAGT